MVVEEKFVTGYNVGIHVFPLMHEMVLLLHSLLLHALSSMHVAMASVCVQIPALQAVGWEGFWGLSILSTLLFVMSMLPSTPPSLIRGEVYMEGAQGAHNNTAERKLRVQNTAAQRQTVTNQHVLRHSRHWGWLTG